MLDIKTIRKIYEKINSYKSWVNIGALRRASLIEKIKLTILYFYTKIVFVLIKKFRIIIVN